MVKNPPANAEDIKRGGFDPWVRKIPWRRKCNLFHCSCLETPLDRGAWQSTVHRVAKSWTQLKRISTHLQRDISMKIRQAAHFRGLHFKGVQTKCGFNLQMLSYNSHNLLFLAMFIHSIMLKKNNHTAA